MQVSATHSPGAYADPTMPFILLGLDRAYMEPRLRRMVGGSGQAELTAARIVRWKRGRRCVIEYDLRAGGQCRTLVGKVRAKSLDVAAFELAQRLTNAGLGPDSPDGISIPPPRGTVAECHMWLQDKVSGTDGWNALSGPDGALVAARIGRALAKLQTRLPRLRRSHSIAHEMSHLEAVFAIARARHPEWSCRLRRVLDGCAHVARTVRDAPVSGVHRDFYHDQVIAGADRIWLLDLDLAAQGDPAVDVGNFTAHVVEQSLRLLRSADALSGVEAAFVAGYLEAGGRASPESADVYKTLTLARHIYLSTTFEERRPYTEALVKLCEHRLQL